MKAAIIIMLIGAGTFFLPCMAGNHKQKDSGFRSHGITMFTDLVTGVADCSPNLGFTYRFHPNWSISAESGIRLTGGLPRKDMELSEHVEDLLWPEQQKEKNGEQKMNLPLAGGAMKLSWWPYPEKWTGYLEGGMEWTSRAGPEFSIGLGWDIDITVHLILSLGISAKINSNKVLGKDCLAIKLGYRF